MTRIKTAHLTLHAVDVAEARRIRDRAPLRADTWADDYPFEGDRVALNSFLHGTDRHGEQRPFGYYQITRQPGRLAIGGIGFKGPPDAGAVEVGYGLVPSARGHGYAAEALLALLEIARTRDVILVRADTAPDNVPSRRTLQRAGFAQVACDDELVHYEARLG